MLYKNRLNGLGEGVRRGAIGGMNYSKLTAKDLEDLRDQITDYFETYYAELRSSFSTLGPVEHAALPEFLRGYRRVVTEMGLDGVVITHWPAGQDSFDFHISPERSAADLAAGQCAGERILDYAPGEDFGSYELTEPLKLAVDDRVVWVAPWTRLDVSSSLEIWSDAQRARQAARTDLQQHLGTESP